MTICSPALRAARRPGSAWWRWAGFALAAALVAIPFFAVRFPPITDLPQQAAQIRLAGEALADPGGPYRIQWLTPYLVSYLALGAGWAAGGPLAAGRLGMALIAVAWVGAVHLVAARRGRPPAAAVLASCLVFNHVVYWGFYSFAVGWPAFALWLLVTLRDEPPTAGGQPVRPGGLLRETVLALGCGALLYACHALWLAAGAGWLAVWTLARPRRLRRGAARLAGLAPVLALAAWWFHGVSGTGFATPPLWIDGVRTPLVRLAPGWWTEAALGGLRGPLEPLLVALMLGWLGAGALAARRRRGVDGGATDDPVAAADAPDRTVSSVRSRAAADPAAPPAARFDRPLLLAAATLLGAALVAPDKYTNTIQFAERWVPCGLTLLLLAAPAPFAVAAPRRWPRRLAAAVAAAALALLVVVTTAAWRRFERVEMSGMDQALGALDSLPAAPRVLGLVFVRTSRWVDGKPFLQGFAYAQLAAGGTLNFSFAEFAPSPVVWKRRPEMPWTSGLEWFPGELRVGDFRWFDAALIGAPPELHRRFAADPLLDPANDTGIWRLYRIDRQAVEQELERLKTGR